MLNTQEIDIFQASSSKYQPQDDLCFHEKSLKQYDSNDNLSLIINELFKNNIVRARDLFADAIIQAQRVSPYNTPIYVALIFVINSVLPDIAQLID
ncbi:unnamed protein product [Rotaria sp. Silwood1]|nr:unnamed protein product [Rotaria sp. Silwood1]CAF3796045.1 unnamed protein product [Rotaria sp. Silwood1]CAF3866968.1 unnamed protein product [Rotaria sp. Silwood1]CAF4729897.1 unnamed protein product [Rotaria sp. Silwood1]CAF4832762.1 unnamed protein product [Rotaria sp. Silwood1]